jgi:hypothetical protein
VKELTLTKKAYVDEIFYANEISYVDDIQRFKGAKKEYASKTTYINE